MGRLSNHVQISRDIISIRRFANQFPFKYASESKGMKTTGQNFSINNKLEKSTTKHPYILTKTTNVARVRAYLIVKTKKN